MHPLQIDFARAGLPLELRMVPLAAARGEDTEQIVQMDISREPRKRGPLERFRIYRGNEGNRLEVLGMNESIQQLVLLVDEPSRPFTVRVATAVAQRRGLTVLRRERGSVLVEQHTTARERRFLCGMDEQHLFIALLPDAVESVSDAHACLRDRRVDEAEARSGQPAIRQGEWFFVPISGDEDHLVKHLARKVHRARRHVGIAEAAGIRRVGRPHIAEEVLVVPGRAFELADEAPRVYVRGAVQHPDHQTLVLLDWHLTFPNRESIEEPIEGIGWID
ncbi:MAG: hypothetical protein U0359_09470 [Byssovorax sp.]